MITFIENGERYIENTGFYYEISRAEYERLLTADVEREIYPFLSDSDIYRYGYKGFRLTEKNGKAFLGIITKGAEDERGRFN